jgi:hypothetical protein
MMTLVRSLELAQKMEQQCPTGRAERQIISSSKDNQSMLGEASQPFSQPSQGMAFPAQCVNEFGG